MTWPQLITLALAIVVFIIILKGGWDPPSDRVAGRVYAASLPR
jgi:hypothetical protein